MLKIARLHKIGPLKDLFTNVTKQNVGIFMLNPMMIRFSSERLDHLIVNAFERGYRKES